MQTNVDIFKAELVKQYRRRINEGEADYIPTFMRMTPDGLADRMVHAFIRGSANKDGKGIQRTCKALGIKYTYKAIFAFLKEGA